MLTFLQDLDTDEIKRKFFSNPRDPDSARVKLLEEKVDELEADNERQGALRQMLQVQDE